MKPSLSDSGGIFRYNKQLLETCTIAFDIGFDPGLVLVDFVFYKD